MYSCCWEWVPASVSSPVYLGSAVASLMTPLLIFIGVPPAVAVGSEANQLVATSITGVLAHWRRKSVDFKMGSVLLVGGVIGSTGGVFLFKALQKLGQIDLVISLCYVVFLGIIGLLMFSESMRSMLKQKRGVARRGKLHKHTWVHGLPFKMRFHKSRLIRLRIAAAVCRRAGWRPGGDHGCRRRLYYGAGYDLLDRHANVRRRGHIAFPDFVRRRQRYVPASVAEPNC